MVTILQNNIAFLGVMLTTHLAGALKFQNDLYCTGVYREQTLRLNMLSQSQQKIELFNLIYYYVSYYLKQIFLGIFFCFQQFSLGLLLVFYGYRQVHGAILQYQYCPCYYNGNTVFYNYILFLIGIDLVVCLMEKGEAAKVIIPSKLAYGAVGL